MSRHPTIRISHRDILFESEDFIAVNKKPGWPTHQTLDPNRPNLFSALKSYLKNRNHGEDTYLALHHRLDVGTSGVILFSKSKRANPVLAAMFKDRTATKIYEAMCVGRPPASSGTLVDFLGKKRDGKMDRVIRVERGGKKAMTHYRVVAEHGPLTHVEFELITGRMHQIRVQCALAGFPVLGDTVYGDEAANHRYGRKSQVLHARRLRFDDPLSNVPVEVEAPLPAGFLNAAATAPSGSNEARYILFHKPFGVLSQFTKVNEDDRSLADFDLPSDVYPVGRLDKDSEGLLLLTNDGRAKDQLAHPRHGKEKCYWVQVERVPSDESLAALRAGVVIKGRRTKPCTVRRMEPPALPPRDPPIRHRATIPTCWLELVITEGKNRQVRRMTAAVGHPTLRLVRARVGPWTLGSLQPGEWRAVPSF